MVIRKDQREEIDLYGKVEFTSAKETRDFILETWKIESPKVIYRYYVETLADGKRIYLERPGRLNKGCDFVIYIEDLTPFLFKNGNDKPPKFDDVVKDLRKKAALNKNAYTALRGLIGRVHQSERLQNILQEANSQPFNTGLSCETILKLCKWFFIEQDITYWSGTGRDMLWSEIQKI